MNLQGYQPVVEKIVSVVDYVLLSEFRLFVPDRYDVDAVDKRVAIVASFNPMAMGQRDRAYRDEAVTRRISAALDGLPVTAILRKSDLYYVISLSGRPQMPKMVPMPEETRPGWVSLGVQYNGKIISKPWNFVGHMMIVGRTRSGKSNALRLIAAQALRDGFQLAIADNDMVTFSMLKGHPALFAPVASTPDEAYELIEKVYAECDSRSAQFRSMPGFPDTLDEYNELAKKQGREPLPPMLVVLDELSNTIIRSTRQKALTNLLGALGMRTLKFGIHITYAAHEWTKDQIGLIRPQCETVVAFGNDAREMSALMGCAGAERIPEERKGLAVTNRWGRLQTYYLDKARLGNPTDVSQEPLPKAEAVMVIRSLEEAEGRMTIPLLRKWGMEEWAARSLLDEYEARGWLVKDPQQKNARCVTRKLADLVSNAQTAQTASNTQIWPQTVSNASQTQNMA